MVFKEALWRRWHFSKTKLNNAGSYFMIQWIEFLAQETKSSNPRIRSRKKWWKWARRAVLLEQRVQWQNTRPVLISGTSKKFIFSFHFLIWARRKTAGRFSSDKPFALKILKKLLCPETKLLMKNSGSKNNVLKLFLKLSVVLYMCNVWNKMCKLSM